MPQDKRIKLHRVYAWAVAVLIILVGLALILSCLDICSSGDRPFSRAVIAQHFGQIAALVWLCLTAVLGGIVLSLVFPTEKQRPKAMRDEAETLRRLRAKVGAVPEADREVRLRRIYRFITAAVVIAAAFYPVFYFLNSGNFTIANLNQDVIRAVVIVLIATAFAFVTLFICGLLERKSILREIDILKKQPAQTAAGSTSKKADSKSLLITRIAVFVAAVFLIVLGIFNEGIADVLGKAIRICTECIGLG